MLERCLESALWVFPSRLYLSCDLKGDSLSSRMDCPAHPSGSWLNYAARQAGIKEPTLLKRGIIAGLIRACHAQCCCQCALWGTGDRVAASHKLHQQPWSVPWKCKPPVPHGCRFTTGNAMVLLCRASCTFHKNHLKMTPQVLSVPYSRFFWESISVGSAVRSSQLPYGWTKLAILTRVWRNTLISPAERFYCISHTAIAYSYEIHRRLSKGPCFSSMYP